MALSQRQNVVRWPQFRINSSSGCSRRHRASYSAKLLVVMTLFAVVMTPFVTGTNAPEPIIYQPQHASDRSYVAGSHLLAWWGKRGDMVTAIEQFGGVQQCPEGVDARVDSELLEGDMLSSCRREAAGYDVKELLQPSEEIAMPSEQQMTQLCRSEACAVWLNQAVEATWLPECRYRRSQMSFRSLAETLLRIREDLVATGVTGGVVVPNASLFREFYELNQLSNLLNAKEYVLNEVGSPVMVARQLAAQEDFSLMGSGDSPQLSAAVEPPGSASSNSDSARSISSGSSSSSSNSASNSGSSSGSSSASNSNSVGDKFPSGSDFNSSDTAGFTSSGVGPHASSTATTTELTPSYAYVVGAWVLFNGSYFFLMRRK